MTETPALSAEIYAAVERVVKASADRDALTDAVRVLAGLLGYRLEAETVPVYDVHSTCVCGGEIQYLVHEDPHGNLLGAWWAHEAEPADRHDAELGGPA
jgi:hypothetical protein